MAPRSSNLSPGLPSRFELRMENGVIREAEVRYRTHEVAGVEFVDRAA